MSNLTIERVKFRLLVLPCCEQQVCWINPRLPNFCPECGDRVLGKIKANPGSAIMFVDDEAMLHYNQG